jgi:hypothetical protein
MTDSLARVVAHGGGVSRDTRVAGDCVNDTAEAADGRDQGRGEAQEHERRSHSTTPGPRGQLRLAAPARDGVPAG